MQTFLVRIWMPAAGGAEGVPAGIRGVVEHVGSRRGRPFEGEHDLVHFFDECMQGHQDDQHPGAGGPAPPRPG